MMVQPRCGLTPEDVKVLPGAGDLASDLFIECEAVSPPSARGREVVVWIPASQVVSLLKSAREAAAHARSTPETPAYEEAAGA
jgi:hypothetical protein